MILHYDIWYVFTYKHICIYMFVDYILPILYIICIHWFICLFIYLFIRLLLYSFVNVCVCAYDSERWYVKTNHQSQNNFLLLYGKLWVWSSRGFADTKDPDLAICRHLHSWCFYAWRDASPQTCDEEMCKSQLFFFLDQVASTYLKPRDAQIVDVYFYNDTDNNSNNSDNNNTKNSNNNNIDTTNFSSNNNNDHHHHDNLKPLPHHKDSTLECHGFTETKIAFRTVQGHGTQILQLWTWQALLGARDMENL